VLDQQGVLVLLPTSDKTGFYVCFPFVWLQLYVQRFPKKFANLFKGEWPDLFAQKFQFSYEQWEEFTGRYEVLRTRLFLHQQRTRIKLGELFRGAFMDGNFDGIEVELTELSIMDSQNRFPLTMRVGGKKKPKANFDLVSKSGQEFTWHSLSHVIVNGKGAPGFDIFSIRQRCDGKGYICILSQSRWSDGSTVLTGEAVLTALQESKAQFNEAITILKQEAASNTLRKQQYDILRSCEFLLVAVSNRIYQGPIPTHSGCFVVCAENLELFFGPLSSRISASLEHQKW